jgi:hypothetical protein
MESGKSYGGTERHIYLFAHESSNLFSILACAISDAIQYGNLSFDYGILPMDYII